MNTIVKTKNLNKDYFLKEQTINVLKDVNIEVKEGEFVSVMGASGSGKSTLLYLLGSLDNATSGQIFIRGIELSGMNDEQQSTYRRRQLGFVFQFYNLVPNLTVEENILLPILLDGKKTKDYKKRLDSIIEITGLNHRRKHMAPELSGGQQQRCAIARALIHNPDIILADEPIGNLDSNTGTEVMELFRRINREQKKTIIQVTHSDEAASFGNRIIILKDGKVISA